LRVRPEPARVKHLLGPQDTTFDKTESCLSQVFSCKLAVLIISKVAQSIKAHCHAYVLPFKRVCPFHN
jgi:hypothetical protein